MCVCVHVYVCCYVHLSWHTIVACMCVSHTHITHMCIQKPAQHTIVGLDRTIHIRCIHGIFGREITKYTIIYGVNTVPTLDHCALIIFFGAMETRNEYFATLEIGVRNRVRKREIIPVRAGAQLCAIAKLINVINSG